jgi:hypothetical protein
MTPRAVPRRPMASMKALPVSIGDWDVEAANVLFDNERRAKNQ